jgi:ABC-type Na+ efflux pump permease subunit
MPRGALYSCIQLSPPPVGFRGHLLSRVPPRVFLRRSGGTGPGVRGEICNKRKKEIPSLYRIGILARHEVLRFRTRFRGKTRIAIVMMALAALGIFFFISMGGLVLSKGFYSIGVSPDGPGISDQRFNVVSMDRTSGQAMLGSKAIDIYITPDKVFYRNDSRSMYAAGALKQFLESKELNRISNEYDIDRSFPLRVEVNYLKIQAAGSTAAPAVSFRDLISSEAGQGKSAGQNSAIISSNTGESGLDEQFLHQQLQDMSDPSKLHQFKAEFAEDRQVIIPSLMNPPIPLAQVLLAFFYIVPIFFIIIFFTSSFIEEKLNRRLTILLSAPVRPLEIILGKMLPYFAYSVIVILAITIFLKGDILQALSIFIPVVLFIFAIYLGVALCYRTFKDQSFFSMLAVTLVTGFLVFPAMFTGINNLSYISPLSLAIQMYKGEPYGISEYFFSTMPMYLIFALSLIVGVRVFNEEYLLNYKPLRRKVSEAIYYAIHKKYLNLSIFLLSLLLIPIVFIVELGGIVLATNFPMPLAMWFLMAVGVAVEEVAKSCGIAVLIQNRLVKNWKKVLLLAAISGAAFYLGEKGLMLLSMNVISETALTTAMFSGKLLLPPLVLHVVCTIAVAAMTYRMGTKYYPVALLVSSCLHLAYNITIVGLLK